MAPSYSSGSWSTGCIAASLHAVQIAARLLEGDAGEVSTCMQSFAIYPHICTPHSSTPAQASDTEGVQAALQSVLNETAARLLRPKSKDLLSLQSPLGMLAGIPWLPLDSHIFSGLCIHWGLPVTVSLLHHTFARPTWPFSSGTFTSPWMPGVEN